MSIKTTSGRSSRQASTASAPSPAVPSTLKSGCGRHRGDPARPPGGGAPNTASDTVLAAVMVNAAAAGRRKISGTVMARASRHSDAKVARAGWL